MAKVKFNKKGIGKRLREVRGDNSLQSFGKKIDVAHTTIMRYEEGMVPSPEILLRISNVSGKSVEWLLTGKKEERAAAPIISELPHEDYHSIPLVEGKIAAGEPIVAMEDIIEWVVVHVRPLKSSLAKASDMVACRVSGDSMWPQLTDGDIVVIDRGVEKNKIIKGRMYAVWVDGGLTVKLLQKDGSNLFLLPVNRHEVVRTVDLRVNREPIVGIVIGGWRNFTKPL